MNNCPICSCRTETIIQLNDFPVFISSLPENFNLKSIKLLDDLYIEKCLNCGFISNKKKNKEFYRNLYTNTPKFHTKKNHLHWKKIFEKYKPKNILEIGGGINNLSSILDGKTILSVLDYSIEKDTSKFKKTNIKFIKEEIKEHLNNFTGSLYDAVFMSHVCEHIPDISNFFELLLKSEACKNAKLFLEIPSFYFYSKYAPYYLFNFEHCTHLNTHYLKTIMNRYQYKLTDYFSVGKESHSLCYVFQKGNEIKLPNDFEECSTSKLIINFDRSIKQMTSSIDKLLRSSDEKVALKKGSGGGANLFMYYLKKESEEFSKLVPTDEIRIGNIMSSTKQKVTTGESFDKFVELNPESPKGYISGSLV